MAPAAIFDLDGTLVTFNFDVRGSRKAMLGELSRRGVDVSSLSLAAATQDIIDMLREKAKAGELSEGFDTMRRSLYSILDSFEVESCKKSVLFEGTREALERLDSMSVRLSVMTNSGTAAATELLSRYDLGSFFEFILTRDDVTAMKPRPDGLEKAVSLFAVDPTDVVCVGDSVFDIIAAKKAGLKIISIATGLYTQERLRSEGADYVVASISDVPQVFATTA
jgi:phosphoglycolate phosphatase